ncbi:hypothetical protein MMC08_006294 [Hypocenomyce scalaris]|nr:hypothetical protein [Hypocenomyce scalaris]
MELAPPPGGNQDRGPTLIAVTWTFTAMALVVVGAKVYTRLKIVRETALGDLFTMLSMVLILVCTSLVAVDVKAGMGRHAYYLNPEQRVRATKINFILNPFGIMAYSLPNISVAIFINRILSLRGWRKWGIYGIAIAQSFIAGISCILLFAQCSPAKFLWDPTIPAKCLPSTVITGYSYFVGSYSAFTDIVLAVVPAVTFWKLQMKRKTKVGVSLLMGMTAVAAICAIIKTTKLNELADLDDFTYGTVDLLIWAIVEADVIIIAACIPALRPFALSVSQSVRTSHQGYTGHSSRRHFPLEDMSSGAASEGSKWSNNTWFDTQRDRDPAADHDIRKTTEIATEWEQV